MCIRDSHQADLVHMGGQHDLNLGCRIDDTHHIGDLIRIDPVSYTHLDVYKRQVAHLLKRLCVFPAERLVLSDPAAYAPEFDQT